MILTKWADETDIPLYCFTLKMTVFLVFFYQVRSYEYVINMRIQGTPVEIRIDHLISLNH